MTSPNSNFRLTSVDLNQATYHTIAEACRNDRLIYGVDTCAKYLMTDPNGVFACLLPMEGFEDITTQIYYKLLEAFCNENDVPLIKIDGGPKLLQLINDNIGQAGEKTATDCIVVLIRYPYCIDSDVDQHTDINQYEKEMARHVAIYQKYLRPIPPVVLPDSVD